MKMQNSLTTLISIGMLVVTAVVAAANWTSVFTAPSPENVMNITGSGNCGQVQVSESEGGVNANIDCK